MFEILDKAFVFFAVVAVVLSPFYITVGCLAVVLSRSRSLERSENGMKIAKTVLAAFVAIYLAAGAATVIAMVVVGVPETVRFWDESVLRGQIGLSEFLFEEEFVPPSVRER